MITAIELSKRYGDVVAVDRVGFDVEPGEIVGLVGGNGAGKSTMLCMLAGLVRPSSGRVVIDGVRLDSAPLVGRSRLGFASPDTALYDRLSPRELLRYFGRLHGMASDLIATRIAALASTFDMTGFLDRHCAQLSTGERQKVNLARALLHDPPVLILDEPTATLDVSMSAALIDLLKRRRALGRAALFTSHTQADLDLACDRVIALSRGRVSQ